MLGFFGPNQQDKKNCSVIGDNVATSLPIEGNDLILIPCDESRLNDATISAVAACTVRFKPVWSSMRYKDFGITAIGHLDETEFDLYGQWSEVQIRYIQLSLSTSISSPMVVPSSSTTSKT